MSPDTGRQSVRQLPGDLHRSGEAVFAEPWQAQAFALAVGLMEAGLIEPGEWADTLGDEIKCARQHGIAEDGSGYYELWLRALERIVADRGLVEGGELDALQQAWREAYLHTPHGRPVTLGSAT